MEITLTVKTVSSIEAEIALEELKYQTALVAGAEFQELKSIKQTLRSLRAELDWKKSFPLENYLKGSASSFD